MPTVFLAREALLLVQAMPSLSQTQRMNSTLFADVFFFEILAYWLCEVREEKKVIEENKVKELIYRAFKEATEEYEKRALQSILEIGVERFWPGSLPPKSSTPEFACLDFDKR